jgi:hypothetical protein
VALVRRPVVVPWPADPVGLGDVLAAATKAIGVRPCENCERRRQALNRRVVIGRPRLIRKGANDGR